MSEEITLVTKDGEHVKTKPEFANLSGLIKNVLDDSGPNEEIPLDIVTKPMLEKILEYAIHHEFQSGASPKKPIPSNEIADAVEDSWDAEFIKSMSQDEVINLILACNYLDIKSLLELGLAFIACNFKGKSVEQIASEYGIEQDFTPEVEEELKKEFPWALEGGEERLTR